MKVLHANRQRYYVQYHIDVILFDRRSHITIRQVKELWKSMRRTLWLVICSVLFTIQIASLSILSCDLYLHSEPCLCNVQLRPALFSKDELWRFQIVFSHLAVFVMLPETIQSRLYRERSEQLCCLIDNTVRARGEVFLLVLLQLAEVWKRELFSLTVTKRLKELRRCRTFRTTYSLPPTWSIVSDLNVY